MHFVLLNPVLSLYKIVRLKRFFFFVEELLYIVENGGRAPRFRMSAMPPVLRLGSAVLRLQPDGRGQM